MPGPRRSDSKLHQQADPPSGRIRPLWLYAALIGAVVVTYGRILSHDFVSWDDGLHVVENPHLNPVSLEGLLRLWKEPYFSLYAPLSYSLFAAEAWLAGLPQDEAKNAALSPAVFHAGSLLLHLACVVLVYRLLLLMMTEYSALSTQYSVPSVAHRPAACLGALLFALHPVQVESVAWISEQRGLLAALFSLLSLLAYLAFRAGCPDQHGASGWGYYVWATVAFVMALLAKPSSACLPLLAAGLDLFVLHRSWRVSVLALLPWLALAAGMVLITQSEQPVSALSFVPPLWARPLIAGDALLFYLTKLVWPLDLGILYRRSPEYVMSQPWFWAGGLAISLLAATLAWSRFRAGLLAAGWFVVVLSPVLGLAPFIHQRYSTVADRYAYLAMLGPAYLLAWWFTRGPSWSKTAACAVMLLLCAALSFRQAGHWRDSMHLSSSSAGGQSLQRHGACQPQPVSDAGRSTCRAASLGARLGAQSPLGPGALQPRRSAGAARGPARRRTVVSAGD